VTASGILPVDGLALIFGVYRFLSIALSTCNVIGNTVATVVVAKLAGEFDDAAWTGAGANEKRSGALVRSNGGNELIGGD